VFVWNRRLRPWVLLAGALLHLGIEYSVRVGFFSLAMLTLYLAFLNPEWARDHLLRLRDWLQARTSARLEERSVPSGAVLSQTVEAAGASRSTEL